MAIQLQEKLKLEFISQYFALNKKRPEFVCWINKQWRNFFSYAYTGRKLSEEFLFLYSLYSIAYCSIDVLKEMNEESVLSSFISKQENFLLDSECKTDQMIEKLLDLDVKFEIINPKSNIALLTGVYENNLYIINSANIKLFLEFAYQMDENMEQGHIMTAIMSKKDQPLCKYVCGNLNDTIEIIITMPTKGIDDDEEIILYILNSDQVNEEVKKEYIFLLKTVLHDLSEVTDKNCMDVLLSRHLVEESAENICEYFSKQSLTDIMIRFINEISSELNFSVVAYDENIIQKFAECVQSSNEIVNTHYRSIVSAKGKVLTDFSNVDLVKKILISDNIQDTNKVVLLCEIIKKFECDSIKEVLIVAGYEEVSKLLDSKIRPRILANRKHEQLLEALKEKQFITSYELNEKSGIYNYTRSSKKRNNFPTELL